VALPELAEVWWRPRASEGSLRRSGWLWTAITVAHVIPFLAVAGLLLALKPLLAPAALIALVHAWAIPELYAARGAKVLRPTRHRAGDSGTEGTALGLLGDLLDHHPRNLLAQTGLVLERGDLGAWLVGQAGAVLVRPSGRRVHCYCVRVPDPELPPADRIAHLLLALRADEAGFATLANVAFSGARWRLRRRLSPSQREALAAAAQVARALRPRTGRPAMASATL
jgi:hypothetical protein